MGSARATAKRPRSMPKLLGFTLLGALLPGLGLIVGGRRKLGAFVLTVFLALAGVAAYVALTRRDEVIAAAVVPSRLLITSVLIGALAFLWIVVVVGSHRSLRPATGGTGGRVAGALFVGVLCFAIAAPAAIGVQAVLAQRTLVQDVFQSQGESKSATRPTTVNVKDPWEDRPRLNLLLLGGDAGKGRTGTRTDTVIVASIDTKTGNTTLVSLPRNTGRMPFPADSPLHKYYPNGFTDGDGNNPEYFLNAMYDNVPARIPKDLLGETDNLGADVMKLSVGEATGLDIDYYVEINLAGFEKMINALGGITVNINTYIPIGGNTDLGIPPGEYLEPGPNQHLKGRDALWYARGRYGSDDFARMDRQRCVIDAVIKQANPANMLARYEDIAKAGKDIVKTDMPREVLPLMVDLSLRVKDGNVRSVVFKHGVDGFSSPNPDYSLMRQRVKAALKETKKEKAPSPSSSKKGKSASPKSGGSSEDDKASEDIADSCAYQPKVAATAQPAR